MNDNCEKKFSQKMEKKFGKEWEKKIEKKFENWNECQKPQKNSGGFMGGGFYFLTFIGTAIYYIGQAPNFWYGVLGILKALVWPAMLIYEIFSRLNM